MQGVSGVSVSSSKVTSVAFDWYDGDMSSSPEKYEAFLSMLGNWVAGMKAKGHEAGSMENVSVKPGEGGTMDVTLGSKHASPLHAIFEVRVCSVRGLRARSEATIAANIPTFLTSRVAFSSQLHQGALQAALRRKLQNVILQTEKFGGGITPASVHSSLMDASEEAMKDAKRHSKMVSEFSIDVIAAEKQVATLRKQNKTLPNWGAIRKAMAKWASKMEFGGKVMGRQVALKNMVDELQILQASYINVVQEQCDEKVISSLDILGMTSFSDAASKSIAASGGQIDELAKRKDCIAEQVAELASEYERLNARSDGKEMVSGFDPEFSDVFINPDDDEVDPELVASLRSEIEELKARVEDLKSDKYEKMLEGDGSYGGLMFFAFLQEPHFEEKVRSGEGCEERSDDALRILMGHCAIIMNNISFASSLLRSSLTLF